MKSDYFYPHLGDRRAPADWEADGARPVGEVAREHARELLATRFPSHVPEALDQRIRERFDIRLPRSRMKAAAVIAS